MRPEAISPGDQALQAVYAIIAQSSQAKDLDTILSFALERLLDIAPAASAAIHLLDRRKRVASLIAHRGLSARSAAAVNEVALRREVFQQTLSDSPSAWQSCLEPQEYQRCFSKLGVENNLCVFMRSKGQSIAILSLFSTQPIDLCAWQSELIAAIADHLGISVESARLRNQVEETAIIQERQRIARELHDAVTQTLFSLSLYAKGWRRMADNASIEEIKVWLDRLSTIAGQTLKEMRLLLYELRPSLLEQDGLAGALQRRLELVENKVNIKTELYVDGVTKLPSAIEQELYRITQEALNNALKYSDASLVRITLQEKDGVVELEVFDDGIGFELQDSANIGMGLSSMQERAQKMGGSLQIESGVGEGTRVKASVALGL